MNIGTIRYRSTDTNSYSYAENLYDAVVCKTAYDIRRWDGEKFVSVDPEIIAVAKSETERINLEAFQKALAKQASYFDDPNVESVVYNGVRYEILDTTVDLSGYSDVRIRDKPDVLNQDKPDALNQGIIVLIIIILVFLIIKR